MMKRKLWLRWSILLGLLLITVSSLAASQLNAASVSFLGTRLIKEGDFSGNQDWQNNVSLPLGLDLGGRLKVFLRNTAAISLTITNFTLNGKAFEQLTTIPIGNPPGITDTKWWFAWPNPVPPGETATLSLRVANLAQDIPAGATFALQTNQGTVSYSQFKPQTSPLWMPSLNFAADLSSLTLFVANQGSKTLTLKNDGGVSIDGVNFAGTLPQTTLNPGDAIPIQVSLPAKTLTQAKHAVFAVTAADGTEAFAGLRVYPYHFTIQSHMQGSNYDPQDRAKHFVSDWDQSFYAVIDEPAGHKVQPMRVVEMVQTGLTEAKTKERPGEIHNTSYIEGLVYNDIADINTTHFGNTIQELQLSTTWPKPNWYMPQDTWAQYEGLFKHETWYPLEDLQFQGYQAVARGAKAVQWFLYMNHWQQGWGRQEGQDFARIFQDKYRSGHVANPVLWHRIGRISGALTMLEPYLTKSAPFTHTLEANIAVETLVNSDKKAVTIVLDYRTPHNFHGGYPFRYGLPDWNQQVLYDFKVKTKLPAYVFTNITKAYVIDPWTGFTEIALQKLDTNEVELTIPELRVGTLVVLGDASDGVALNNKWAQQMNGAFSEYGDLKAAMLAGAKNNPSATWAFPNYNYRQTITTKNNTTNDLTVLALPINLGIERTYSSADFRAVENNGSTTEVPFFLDSNQVYEAFASTDTVARLRKDGIPSSSPTSWYSLEYDNTEKAVKLISDVNDQSKVAGFAWSTSIGTKALPWTTIFADNNIPARFDTFAIDAKIDTFPFWYYNKVVFYFDPDGDGYGVNDKSRGFQLVNDIDVPAVQFELGGGWKRYVFDVQKIFNYFSLYPGQKLRGQYKFALQSQILAGAQPAGKYFWAVRQIQVSPHKNLFVKPSVALFPGATKTYQVYYDVQDNTRSDPSPKLDSTLANTTIISTTTLSQTTEIAGASVKIAAKVVTITTQANVSSLILRHIGNENAIVSSQKITATVAQTFKATLTRAMAAGEMLVVIPLQKGGEGQVFCFDAQGDSFSNDSSPAKTVKAVWSKDVAFRPYTMDMTSDGQKVAVGFTTVADDRSSTAGYVQLLDSTGKLLWEKSYKGRVFFVRFSPDGTSIYVAANLSADGKLDDSTWFFSVYSDSQIVRYDLTGTEKWRHKVGSGTDLPAAQQGRTVFAMEVFPNGDLLYSEWNTYGIKLSKDTGNVVWYAKTSTLASYTPAVIPLNDGGGILHGMFNKRIAADGTLASENQVRDGEPLAAGAASDGSLLAYSGNVVRLVGKDGKVKDANGVYAGQYVRKIAVSADGAYVATGSINGFFTLMDSSGKILWQKHDGGASISDLRFLANGAGVAFAKEVFDYQHANNVAKNGWRYRDLILGYDLQGNPLWRHEGPWRDNDSFMSQFVISSDNQRMAILSGEDVRFVDLTNAPKPDPDPSPYDPYNSSTPTPLATLTPTRTVSPSPTTSSNLTPTRTVSPSPTTNTSSTSTPARSPTPTTTLGPIEEGGYRVFLPLVRR